MESTQFRVSQALAATPHGIAVADHPPRKALLAQDFILWVNENDCSVILIYIHCSFLPCYYSNMLPPSLKTTFIHFSSLFDIKSL
jgi:hypothetical protein